MWKTAAFALTLAIVPALPAHADMAPSVAACALAPPEAVSALFGQPLVPAEQEPMGGGEGEGRMTACFWEPEGGRLGPTVSLVVWSWPPGSGNAAGFLEAIRTVAGTSPDAKPPETVAIGDDALWDGDRLHVRKGEIGFSLSTSLNALDPTPDARAKLEGLARRLAGAL